MSRSTVKVIVRTRPTANFASRNLIIDLDQKSIQAFIPKDHTQGPINNQQQNWKFKFDEILHNATQEQVYDVGARELVSSVVQGYNGTVIAYGQTGAGKTYTMSGGAQNYKFRGIIPRAISALFSEVESRPQQAYTIRVSFAEIYNQLIYDLLSPTPPAGQTGNIMIQEDPKHGIVVKGLQKVVCSNQQEALNQLFEGETNRTIAEHKLNKSSTRSHCLYTLYVQSRSRVQSSEKVVFSKLNLIDLAGSERTKKTGSEGLTLAEANFINKSLTYLEQVVIALAERGRDHVPYRQSKLTYMLKDSIGGNSRTVMIANVWPEPAHIQESISTFRFATRMMRVTNQAVINIELDSSQLIQRFKKEVRDLRQELAMHDTLANRGRITYEPYSAQQQFEMQQMAENYLDGGLDDLQVDSLRQVKELFVQMRNVYKRTVTRLGVPDYKAQSDETQGEIPQQEEIEESGLQSQQPELSVVEPSELEESKEMNLLTPKHPLDKNQAFMEFKNTLGKSIQENLNRAKSELVQKKLSLKNLTSQINSIKKGIDSARNQLQVFKRNKPDQEEDMIEQEEFEMMNKLKGLKKQYREIFGQLQVEKEETASLAQNIEEVRQNFILEFQQWYQDRFGPPSKPKQVRMANEELIQDDIDPDAVAYIKAKKHVHTLHKAKRTLGAMGKAQQL